MSRIDQVILTRLSSRIGVTVLLMFGIIALVESLNTWRFDRLAELGGPFLGLLAIGLNAALWTLGTLPVILLVGAIIGLLELQARRELTVINASGISVWQVLRAPLLMVVAAGALLSFVGDTAIVTTMRSLSLGLPQAVAAGGPIWMEQKGDDGLEYVLVAEHQHPGGTVLEDVTFFLPEALPGPRLRAPIAELTNGAWRIPEGVRFTPDAPPQRIAGLMLPTTTTVGDLGARVASPSELTIFELIRLQALQVSDPALRSGVQMRLAKLLALPLMLAASLIIAFAFTAGYRRTNKYGATVLYGIVLGFVVYVVTEMAAMAGSAGILQPAFAAFAPAFVALVIGTTVLLYREDGRR
jgi:lipopolysaccharide export system permease protein